VLRRPDIPPVHRPLHHTRTQPDSPWPLRPGLSSLVSFPSFHHGAHFFQRSDSVRFGRIHPTLDLGLSRTHLDSETARGAHPLPAVAFLSAIALSDGGSEGGAPGAAADASVRRHERVRASSPPPFPPRPEPAILASRFPLSRFLAFRCSPTMSKIHPPGRLRLSIPAARPGQSRTGV